METTSVTDSNEQLCDQVQILLQRVDQYRNDAQRMEEAKYALEAAIANIDLVGYPQLVEIKRNMEVNVSELGQMVSDFEADCCEALHFLRILSSQISDQTDERDRGQVLKFMTQTER